MSELIELCFIDGSMRGTFKFVHREELIRSREYKVYVPRTSTFKMEDSSPSNVTGNSILCYVEEYLWMKLPSNFGRDRYVLFLVPIEM